MGDQRQKLVPKVLDRLLDFKFAPLPCTGISEVSLGVCNHETCLFKTRVVNLTVPYLRNIQKGLQEVDSLLNELGQAESLYSSSTCLTCDFPMYGSNEFKVKLDGILVWYNTCMK